VHALPGFVLGHLARVLQAFQARYPQIVLDMIVHDAAIDPVREGFDCALQLFAPRSEDLVSRRLFPVRRVFCASPKYLREHGLPRHPSELGAHRIGWYSGYPTRERLAFHGSREEVTIDLAPALLSNSVHLLREYALEHAAIVCLPTLVAAEPIVDGRLALVLPDFPLGSFTLSAYYPTTLRNALKLRLFLEMLGETFGDCPPWDAALIERGYLPELASG